MAGDVVFLPLLWAIGFVCGWTARDIRAERDRWLAEEQRDAARDAEHLTKPGAPDA